MKPLGSQVKRRLGNWGLSLVAALALCLSWSGLARGGALPTPAPLGSVATLPPIDATATPAPSGKLLKYSGEILDLRGSFVFFTTGDAFRLAPDYKLTAASGTGPTTLKPVTRTYAIASFDSGSGAVVALALSRQPLPQDASYDQVKNFAVAISTPFPNPDIQQGGEGYDGKPVFVVFTVQVPPNTPFTDQVYIATDTSGWSPTALKMDRIDALHYRAQMQLPSGTKLLYRYTRGSWGTSERGQNGLQTTHSAVIPNLDVKRLADTVYSWADQTPNNPNPAGVSSTATPYNPIPFVTPPHAGATPPHK
jgi:hypothetical protein